jgi:hypothetical protein
MPFPEVVHFLSENAMIANLGFGVLVITLAIALYSAAAAIYGARAPSH